MNKRQKLVQKQFLNNEETVIKRLKGVYEQSLKDITGKVFDLDKSIGALQKALADVDDDEIGDLAKAFLGRRANISPEEAKETLQSMIQSKVYQKRYQEALKGQIDGIMDKMHGKEYKVVSDYLQECYEDGFIGTMFDLQGQGIPLCFPLDQEAMVRAVQLDSKISQGLYSRLGEDVSLLKKKITAQVSRGIATGMSYQQVARGLSAYTNIGYNNAVRIARTEGHRIQVQGTMDACYKAKEKGADVVKQWDSTLDGRTRESHAQVDGEIRELDKKFSNGLMFPGDPSGGAAEVVNCRCALLQRARWALDESELETLQKRAEYFGLDKAETFEDYKNTYLKASEGVKAEESKPKFVPAKTIEEAEQYADRFVSSVKNKYSGNVNYSGIQLDFANEMNRAMTDVFDAYDPQRKLSNVSPFNTREKRFKGETSDGAYQWGTGDLFYNKAYYKNKKAFDDHLQQYESLLNTVMPNIDKAISTASNGISRRYLEALKNTGRTNVFPPDAYGTTIHEMGHYLDDQLFRGAFKQSAFDLSASYNKYAGGISAYATSTQQEYVAESFAAYWKGETGILDPDLVKIFGGLRK